MRSRRIDAGFTLLEVLVALCVLAAGMLGVGMMLLESIRSSRSALHRTAAVALAADLGERIRANRMAGDDYAIGAGTLAGAPPSECAPSDACGPSDVAALDLYEWQQAVLTALPAAVTSVQVAPVSGLPANTFAISIRWAQPGDAEAATFILRVQA
jgi:type IV pilus assembly protein PilV